MGFTEIIFIFAFLPASILLYLIAGITKKNKIQNAAILVLSIAFYAWSSLETLLLFIILCSFIYLLGYTMYLRKKSGESEKKGAFASALILLTPLCYFKYTEFVFETINDIFSSNLTFSNVIVPIGISFVVFEGISYVIDIERGLAKPGSFFDALLFLSFFPKIVSGPIVLWRDFAPQLNNHPLNLEQISHGFQRIIIGYAEKAILADTFGLHIAQIESLAGNNYDTLTLWLKALLYFFEIYFDFSGYSQIAIGLSEVFGFSFKENFNYPYFSTSIPEFWRRWHISLGNFFKEYVYIPLGGNRKGNVYVNLFIVFLLTGIWHGANWTFMIWGCIHGIFMVIDRLLNKTKFYNSIPKIVKWFFTMLIVFFAWIIFQSESIDEAFQTYKAMFVWVGNSSVNIGWRFFASRKIITLIAISGVISILPVFKLPEKIKSLNNNLSVMILKKIFLLSLLFVDILFIVNSTYSPFIYFQF